MTSKCMVKNGQNITCILPPERERESMVEYLHIQIIVILQMNYLFNISICYIWKSCFLQSSKQYLYFVPYNGSGRQ